MRILVSACLLGVNCKYNGKSNRNPAVLDFLRGKTVTAVCPELLSGLGTPRPCAEIRGGVVVDQNGNNVDKAFRRGTALALLAAEGADLAVLQPRSPTCGVHQIYDGTFTGRLVPGMGIFAQALQDRGIRVVDADDISEARGEFDEL